MSLYGKTTSAKRSKPSYALAIVGVALILFLIWNGRLVLS